MAEVFYAGSYENAERNGELEQWKRSWHANVDCAQGIGKLISSHARGRQLGRDCAKTALERWGFHRVQFILAHTLVSTGNLGFEPDSVRWARSAYMAYEPDNHRLKVHADRLLLAQFVQQTYAEYRELGMFGHEHCGAPDQDYAGKVLVLRPERLKEDCWSAQNQLWYGECGFGCSPTARGQAVFATCLGDGETARWNRLDFMGVLDEQHLPDWAAERLAGLRGPAEGQDAAAQGQADSPAQKGSPQKRLSAFVGGGEARELSGECPEGVSHGADFASTMEMR